MISHDSGLGRWRVLRNPGSLQVEGKAELETRSLTKLEVLARFRAEKFRD